MKKVLNAKNAIYLWIIGVCAILQIIIYILQNQPEWVEYYYSRGFYPIFSFISIILFSWIPFSVGDIFYGMIVLWVVVHIVQLIKYSFQRKEQGAIRKALQLVSGIILLYTFFYINWGLNYFRVPLVKQIGLNLENVTEADFADVLEEYILIANDLRENFDLESKKKEGVRKDLDEWMRQDTLFKTVLSRSQVHQKSPLSNILASSLGVSGYFNPFTQESHVNQLTPLAAFPFVNIHELAHQMGIGFEDECNFIAFRVLKDHTNVWYRYSAYYEAIQYLMYPLYEEKESFERYSKMLSPKITNDIKNERLFWQRHSGWVNRASSIFYNAYLKHNNQPEGINRYSMMAKLIVAWEKQQKTIFSQI